MEMLAVDKCSSLFYLFVSDEEKKVLGLATGVNIIKLFTVVFYEFS